MTHGELAGVLLVMCAEAQKRADNPSCRDHRGMLLQIKFILHAGADYCMDMAVTEAKARDKADG